MANFIINGPNQLKGEVEPSGAKNAALIQIAASLLTKDEVILKNMPVIRDSKNMLLILEKLGAEISWPQKHTVKIKCENIKSAKIDEKLARAMRASVVLAGPLIAREKKAIIPTPGGDLIGRRPIDTHIQGLKQFGVKVNRQKDVYIFNAEINHQLKPAQFFLDEMSVTATQNVMMLASLVKGTSQIRGAAMEPEIEDLGIMLGKMGAKIMGSGTHTITIEGQEMLSGCTHTIIPDRIEIGTLACAIAASSGQATIKNVILEHLENLLNKFTQIGVNFQIKKIKQEKNRTWVNIILNPSKHLKPIYIDTRPYPGFSTDLQAPMALLLTQAQGQSHIFETLFEGRLEYAKELNKLGAKIKIVDKHNIIIIGPSKLKGGQIDASDIRAGATLVLAGLIAQGKTIVKNIEILERGYERFEEKLQSLGAKIEKSEKKGTVPF